MKKDWSLRFAREDDIPALEKLIPISVRGLSAANYSSAQMDAAIGSVFGVDRQLIRDGTYYVVELGGASSREPVAERRHRVPPSSANASAGDLIGCGGWSKRRTLFGGDHHQTTRDDALLDPVRDAARIRAFFIHPEHARCGIGRAILDDCEKAIRAAGFKSIELAATLPGVPFYTTCGYSSAERSEVPLTNELSLSILRMKKRL